MIFTSLFSLGGLPPLLGFLQKWIIIQAIITNKLDGVPDDGLVIVQNM